MKICDRSVIENWFARRGLVLFVIFAIISVVLKYCSSLLGYNYDLESYCLVATIVTHGGSVYAETSRYNYGPLWFYFLGLCKTLSIVHFRLLLILFLASVDIGIAAILWRQKYRLPALLFLLSPVVIYISGFHNQFDNVAVLLGMLAVVVLAEKSPGENTWPRFLLAAVILGISLIVKHLLVFLLFWLFFRQRSWTKKILIVLIPSVMFLGSFLPYMATEISSGKVNVFISATVNSLYMTYIEHKDIEVNSDHARNYVPITYGIINNVFNYQSMDNKIFYSYFLPPLVQLILAPGVLFFGGLILLGWLLRKWPGFESFLLYTAWLVILATATTNQYLAIPAAFTAVFWLPLGIVYNFYVGFAFYWNPLDVENQFLFGMAIGLLLASIMIIHRRIIADSLQKVADFIKK